MSRGDLGVAALILLLYIGTGIWVFVHFRWAWTLADLAAFFQIIYTTATVLMLVGLYVTARYAKKELDHARTQLEYTRIATIGSTLQQIGANDLAIKGVLAHDPTIYAPLGTRIHSPTGLAPEMSDAERKLSIYFSMQISHCKHIFLQQQLRQLYPTYWEAVDRDMEESMKKIPEFRRVWRRVAPFQPEEFQRYMNEKLVRVEKDSGKAEARGG